MEVSPNRREYFIRPTSRRTEIMLCIVMDLWFSENFPILLLKFTLFYFNHPSAAYRSLIVSFEVILFPKIFWCYRYANGRGAVNLAPIPYLCRANTYSRSNTWHWRPYARSPLPLAPSPRSLSEFTWAAAPTANKSQNQGGVVGGRVRERALPSGDNPNFRSPHLEASSAPARRPPARTSHRDYDLHTFF